MAKAKQPKNIADGKLGVDAKTETLYQLLHEPRANPFGTRDVNKFEAMLTEAGLVDLQRMAIQCGISASGTRPTLQENLRTAFARIIGSYKGEYTPQPSNNEALGKKIDAIINGK
jgi:hypothetical protein